MNKNKKVGILLVLSFALVLSTIIVFSGNIDKRTNDAAVAQTKTIEPSGGEASSETIAGAELMLMGDLSEQNLVSSQQATDNVTAGVSVVFGETLGYADIQKEDTAVVAEATEPTPEQLAQEALQAEWGDKLMADVETQMNVRAEASAESGIVGRLHKGDLATIVEEEGDWYKITSGNVEGYVSAEYCLTGMDAYEYAMTNCHTMATSMVGGLRIRKEMSTDSAVVKALGEKDQILVDTLAPVEPGWVAVIYNKQTCYVSAEYVTVELSTGTAFTLEEEAEIERKKKEAAAKAKQTGSSGTVTGSALASSVDDVTLLAALISCEGGNQVYECQLGVGAVVVNRVKSGRYPNSLVEVIYQRGQFGPASNGALARKLANGGVNQTSYAAAQAALNGDTNVGEACSFKLVSSGHEGIAIGAFVFY